MDRRKQILVLSALLGLSVSSAAAQDSSSSSSSSSDASAAPPAPPGPPMEGLFTPAPQYPTPQTPVNPQPLTKEGEDPIKQIFNIQPQYPNSQTQTFVTPDAPKGTQNHLEGLFTGQNPFKTPQTPENPQPVPKNLIPGFGTEEGALFQQLKKGEDGNNGLESTVVGGGVNPAADAKDGKDSEGKDKDAKDKEKDKDGKAKDKDGKDKDGKDKDAKDDKEAKDKDGKDTKASDKDVKSSDKDAEKDKEKDPKASGSTKDGNSDSAGKEKTADDKKDAKADEDKDKEKEKEKELPKATGPYNPLQEAIFLLNNGNHQAALTSLAKLVKAHPTWAEAHYVTAVVFVAMRQYKYAADEYNLVLRLVPTTPLAQMALQGLQKIGMPAQPAAKFPPLRQR